MRIVERLRRRRSPEGVRLWLLAEAADRVTIWHEVSAQGELIGPRLKDVAPWTQMQGAASEGTRGDARVTAAPGARAQHLVLSLTSGDKDLALFERETWGGARKRMAGAWPGHELVSTSYTHTGLASKRAWPGWLRWARRPERESPQNEPSQARTRTGGRRWLYATDLGRVREIGPTAKMLSVRALLREALMRGQSSNLEPEFEAVEAADMLVTVIFNVSQGLPEGLQVDPGLILAHVTSQYEIRQFQFTALAGKTRLNSLTDSFAQRCGLSTANLRLIQMTGQELFAGAQAGIGGGAGNDSGIDELNAAANAAAAMQPVAYPAEPKLFGLEISRFWSIAVTASIGLLITEVAWSGYVHLMAHITAQNTIDTMVQSDALKDRYKKALFERWGTMVQAGSVDPAKVVDLARAVHRDAITVLIDADRASIRLTQKFKLSNADVDQAFLEQLLMPVMPAQKLPSECTQKGIETNRQLTEFYIHVECQSIDPVLRDSLGRNIR